MPAILPTALDWLAMSPSISLAIASGVKLTSLPSASLAAVLKDSCPRMLEAIESE